MRSKYFSATTPIHKEFLGKLKDSLAWDNKTMFAFYLERTNLMATNRFADIIMYDKNA